MRRLTGLLLILSAAMLLAAACGGGNADATATANAEEISIEQATLYAAATLSAEQFADEKATLEAQITLNAEELDQISADAATLAAAHTEIAGNFGAQATSAAEAIHAQGTADARMRATLSAGAEATLAAVEEAAYTQAAAQVATIEKQSTNVLESWQQNFMDTPAALMTQQAHTAARVTQAYELLNRVGMSATPLALTATAQRAEIAALQTQTGQVQYYPLFPTIEYIVSYQIPPGMMTITPVSLPIYTPSPPPLPSTWTPSPTYPPHPTITATATWVSTPTPPPTLLTGTATPLLFLTDDELPLTGTAWANLIGTQTAAASRPTPSRSATWTPSPSAPGQLDVTIAKVEGTGDINNEEVQLLNQNGTINLEGWKLCNQNETCYTFERVVLFPRMSLVVRTRSGDDSPAAVYWGREEAAWSPGDRLQLSDDEGEIKARWVIPE